MKQYVFMIGAAYFLGMNLDVWSTALVTDAVKGVELNSVIKDTSVSGMYKHNIPFAILAIVGLIFINRRDLAIRSYLTKYSLKRHLRVTMDINRYFVFFKKGQEELKSEVSAELSVVVGLFILTISFVQVTAGISNFLTYWGYTGLPKLVKITLPTLSNFSIYWTVVAFSALTGYLLAYLSLQRMFKITHYT